MKLIIMLNLFTYTLDMQYYNIFKYRNLVTNQALNQLKSAHVQQESENAEVVTSHSKNGAVSAFPAVSTELSKVTNDKTLMNPNVNSNMGKLV